MTLDTSLGAVCALFFVCLFVTVALTPIVMRLARRIDAVDRGGYRKVFQGEMPLLGGLAFAVPLVFSCLAIGILGHVIVRNWEWVWRNHRDSFDLLFTLASYRRECLTLAAGGIAIVVLGVLDDMKSLRARWKLLGQVVVALFVCLSGFALTSVTIPFVGTLNLGIGLGGILTVLWVVGLINAFNLIDGIDGLASGIALVGTCALVVLGVVQGNEFVTFVGAALAGCLTAFLFYNFPPARIFLGDTGSMFIGYTLAMMALIGAQKSETAMIILAPMLALSLPIFETLISMTRRYVGGVPVFAGDNLHTHHRLLRMGYSQPGVVLTLCGTGLLFAIAAIMSALIPENSKWVWFPYALYIGSLVNIAWLAGYLRPTNVRSLIERRHRNKVYQAFRKYAALRIHTGVRSGEAKPLLELCRCELGLRYIAVCVHDREQLIVSPSGSSRDEDWPSYDEVRIKSSDKKDVLVCYEFKHPPDQNLRHDVSLCLAGIFDSVRLERFCDARDTVETPVSTEEHPTVVRFKPGSKRGANE
ncbi:MAG: MraY family glycosyltransferase [Candidatus Hydrogenedentales bacterium]